MALAQVADLEEEAGHSRQGPLASVLDRHRGNLVLEVRLEVCGPLQVVVVEVHRVLPHQGPHPSSVSQVEFPGSPPHLRLEVDRVEDRQTQQDDRATVAQTCHHVARPHGSVASPTSLG